MEKWKVGSSWLLGVLLGAGLCFQMQPRRKELRFYLIFSQLPKWRERQMLWWVACKQRSHGGLITMFSSNLRVGCWISGTKCQKRKRGLGCFLAFWKGFSLASLSGNTILQNCKRLRFWYLRVCRDNTVDRKLNAEAVYKKGHGRLRFLGKLRSFNVCTKMSYIFCKSVVESAICCAAICWGSSVRASDSKKLSKLIKKAGSVLVTAPEP